MNWASLATACWGMGPGSSVLMSGNFEVFNSAIPCIVFFLLGKCSATCRGCAASAWDELRKPRNLGRLRYPRRRFFRTGENEQGPLVREKVFAGKQRNVLRDEDKHPARSEFAGCFWSGHNGFQSRIFENAGREDRFAPHLIFYANVNRLSYLRE